MGTFYCFFPGATLKACAIHFEQLRQKQQQRELICIIAENVVKSVVRDASAKAYQLYLATQVHSVALVEAAISPNVHLSAESSAAEKVAIDNSSAAETSNEPKQPAVVASSTTQLRATPVIRVDAAAPEISEPPSMFVSMSSANVFAGDSGASRLYVLRAGPSVGRGAEDKGDLNRGPAIVKMEGSVNDQGVDVRLQKQAQKWKSAQARG